MLQGMVATAHVWGAWMYFVTGMLVVGEGLGRKEAVYRWGYWVGMNVPWLVVSGWVLVGVWREVGRAVGEYEEGGGKRDGDGDGKGEKEE